MVGLLLARLWGWLRDPSSSVLLRRSSKDAGRSYCIEGFDSLVILQLYHLTKNVRESLESLYSGTAWRSESRVGWREEYVDNCIGWKWVEICKISNNLKCVSSCCSNGVIDDLNVGWNAPSYVRMKNGWWKRWYRGRDWIGWLISVLLARTVCFSLPYSNDKVIKWSKSVGYLDFFTDYQRIFNASPQVLTRKKGNTSGSTLIENGVTRTTWEWWTRHAWRMQRSPIRPQFPHSTSYLFLNPIEDV